MAYLLTDEQLERICDNSPDCGCDCIRCAAFASNMKYHRND